MEIGKMPHAVIAILTTVTLLTGCGLDAQDLPLPGTTVKGDSYRITARFDDALNLAVGAKVKVNGIDVGKVKNVETDNFQAVATLNLSSRAKLYLGATARLRYNTPLGELFVDIRSPKDGQRLSAGDEMTPANTSTAPTVEDALASASLLINGGGLDQLNMITSELQAAVGDRGPQVRTLLERSNTFLAHANATTDDIDRSLNAMASASQTVKSRQTVIRRAVHDIAPTANVLRNDTARFIALLKRLGSFGLRANEFLTATRVDLLALARQTGPILDAFYSLRTVFGPGLKALRHLADVLNKQIPGDWGPVLVSADLGKTTVALPNGEPIPIPVPTLPGITVPTLPLVPPLLSLLRPKGDNEPRGKR